MRTITAEIRREGARRRVDGLVRQAALITLEAIGPRGEWRKPSPERAAWWFGQIREAVNGAEPAPVAVVCPLCGWPGCPVCY